MIGIKISSFDPSNRLLSSPGPMSKMESTENRGRRRFSSKIEAAGSAEVSVKDRKRGLSTISAVVRAGRRIEDDVMSVLLDRW